jgi:hypothetical protein
VKRVHYKRSGWPQVLCGRFPLAVAQYSDDEARVTCKRCLRDLRGRR